MSFLGAGGGQPLTEASLGCPPSPAPRACVARTPAPGLQAEGPQGPSSAERARVPLAVLSAAGFRGRSRGLRPGDGHSPAPPERCRGSPRQTREVHAVVKIRARRYEKGQNPEKRSERAERKPVPRCLVVGDVHEAVSAHRPTPHAGWRDGGRTAEGRPG